ncbi:uncharacterized protein LOC122722112 [Manihot esculenta]|uniref:uncharacterized protein LOC122722112 n=1 Tax=Manihot esculenta TaxID=3983 RepID=UPI001CC5EAB0|nr:uncharacterized protein LOC122722112 [Manihot esculenta]
MSSESQRAADEEVESYAPSEAAAAAAPAPAAAPPPAAAGGPGQDALFQQIAELIRRVTQNVPEVPPPPPVVAQAQPRPPIEKLRKYGATEFRGKKEDDPSAAEFWLGRLTVTEYEREFVRLSKYATEIVPTEEERCKRFEQGLHADIRMYLTVMHIRELSVLVETAHSLERIKEEEQSRRQKGQQKRSQSQYQGQSSASQTSSKRQREF